MSSLQVKDLPAPLKKRLDKVLKEEGRTVRDFVLTAVEHAIAQHEFEQRLRNRGPIKMEGDNADVAGAAVVRKVREDREKQLAGVLERRPSHRPARHPRKRAA